MGALTTARLPETAQSLVVIQKNDPPGAVTRPLTNPHRHAYHELIWTRRGTGHQLVDGVSRGLRPNTIMLVVPGQVQQFVTGTGLSGAIVRFNADLLSSEPASRRLAARAAYSGAWPASDVPAPEVARLEALLDILDTECRRIRDGLTTEAQSHLLHGLLVWLDRWQQTAARHSGTQPSDRQLCYEFVGLLERDFAIHHDAAHYGELLGASTATLSRALVRACGKTTKQLISDRVMLEAARLLRFSSLSVGQVAFRTGFSDPYYFSRAFKRYSRVAPLTYRARTALPESLSS